MDLSYGGVLSVSAKRALFNSVGLASSTGLDDKGPTIKVGKLEIYSI